MFVTVNFVFFSRRKAAVNVLEMFKIGNESVLIQLAQYLFPGLAISNAKR